jgi:tripartite-type tricarboxylate transporter receptor subunit TctC
MNVRWLLSAALLVNVASVSAQPYPDRPVRFVVPYPPGGATDIIARTLGQKLSDALKQQIVVDNRGGAGQIIGTDIVAKSAPNGYTILLASVTHSINPTLLSKLPYDSVKDFAAITLIGSGPNVLVVHPSIAARSVAELVKLLQANPGKYNYASSGNGSGGHLAAELFKGMAKVDINHIPYKGNGPATVDVLAGQVPIMFTSTAPMLPHIRSGKLRGLATTGATRSSATPDIPTIAELGFPGYEASLWYGILAAAGTPPATIHVLNTQFVNAVKAPDVRERFTGLGIDVVGSAPDYFDKHLRAELTKWEKVIKTAKIRTE